MSAMEEPWEPFEASPGIVVRAFRTRTLPPAEGTNSYLVGTGEALLVEPAPDDPNERADLDAWVRESGLELRAIFCTHHHGDHVGAASATAARFGVPLWAHAATAQRLEGKVTFDRLVEDGETISLEGPQRVVLHAIHTPGHAPGHLCLLEDAHRALIAGDMVASKGTILVETTDGDMRLYLESLARLRALEPSMLLPAHGMPIHDADAHLARYITHRLAREKRVLDALRAFAGPARSADLVPTAYADAPRGAWPLAAMSTEAHLIKLEGDGRVRSFDGRWIATGD
ncbi:MAG: MBL fold metallo-hydrolase [Sandaracinaceae bacterium]